MDDKLDEMTRIYDRFTGETQGFWAGAACGKGCAFCCSRAGSIDITTLEGLRIHRNLSGLPRTRQTQIRKVLSSEMKKREAGRVVPCPFLQKNNACMIYAVRPFACRRIYSLHRCSEALPPQVSRQYMNLARKTLAELQQLDANGYSGHISYILHMLEAPLFLETYLAGEFRPEEIMVFGKSHRIVIHRMATVRGDGI